MTKRESRTWDFEAWMEAIDREVSGLVGVSVHDLPDCPFRDWFEAGVGPSSAAKRAVRRAA